MSNLKIFSLINMIGVYVFVGVSHFLAPAFFLKWMPDYIPFHKFMVYFSGVAEIVLVILLVPKQTRNVAAWLIIAMLLTFFTVHTKMLIDLWDTKYVGGAVARIPLQFVLIWWAYSFTEKKEA